MVRNRLLIIFVLTLVFSALTHAGSIRLSQPVQTDQASETFGEPIESLPRIISLATILEDPTSYIGETLALRVEVNKLFQMKGCFFIAQQAGKTIRVSFKDYGFFVPTDIGGRQVTLLGELIEVDVSAAQAKHFSKDLGDSGEVKQGKQYEIVATSVRIPRVISSGG